MDSTPIYVSVIALLCALPLVWWLARRQNPSVRPETPGERLDTLAGWPPEATRKRRIAAGAGVHVQEVNRLLNQFEQMRDMMKKMKGGGLMKMMKRMGGKGGMPKMPF